MPRAFDKVDHNHLFDKLRHFGIAGRIHDWFSSYFNRRRQLVTVMGATLEELEVTSGVPQGSIIGPILFLYVNDVSEDVVESNVASFADDSKIFRRVDSIDEASSLQSDLTNLIVWAESTGLSFNH